MATQPVREQHAFHTYLEFPMRADEISASADLYAFLLGSWELDVRRYWVDVSSRGLRGEVHAARVLEGRAIQDVWIMPRFVDRKGPPDPKLDMYGTTLRVWDSKLQAWRITWINPVNDQQVEQIGRAGGADGRDVIQLGTLPDGTQTRWSFTEITKDSFHWRGESLATGASEWKLEGEFLARRTG